MKKHPSLFFSLILTIAAALSLASCQRAEFDIQEPQAADRQKEIREVIITASIADPSSETRTSYNETESKNYWTPGDKIKIFSAGESSEFTSINTVPETMVKFRGLISFITGTSNDDEDSKDYVWGLYPYSTGATYAEPDGISRTARITTTYTDIQTGVAGTFGDNLAVMIGRSESLSIPFRGAYSGAFFKVNRNDIVSMTLEGLNGEVLAGKATIGLDNSQLPVVYDVADPKTAVTVTAPNGTFEPGANYYIITLPDVALPNGYKVTLRRADGYQGTYELRANRPLNRIKFRNLSDPIDARIENAQNISNGVSTGWVRSTTQGVNEIWYTTSDNEAVTYNVDSETGNEVDSANSVAPADNDGVGIIRFTTPVTEIDSYGFYNLSNLTSVTLPESVETIKAYAFRGCSSLKDINFGSNMKTIKSYAFWEMYGIEELVLPEGLETVEEAAFQYLDHLKRVTIPESIRTFGSVTNGIHHSPFINSHIIERFVGKFASADGRCLILDEADGNKVLLHFAGTGYSGQSYSIPSGVTSIAQLAFDYTAPKSIILPEGLLSIEPDAFSWCSYLESMTIPTTLTSIGTKAFNNCRKLKEVKLKPTAIPTVIAYGSSMGNMFYNPDASLKIYVPGNLLNAYKTTQYWSTYESQYVAAQTDNELWFTLRDGSIQEDAINVSDWSGWVTGSGEEITPCFDSDRQVWVVQFSEPIHSVPAEAFRNKLLLTGVSLPASVSVIGERAFEFCTGLNSVEFGSDFLEEIDDYAFHGCDLSSVNIPNTNRLGVHAFQNNENLTSVTLGSHVNIDPEDDNPFMNCVSLVSFEGDNDLISEDRHSLIKNGILIATATAGLTNFTTPSNVTEIGAQAFYGSTLQNINIRYGVTSLGWAAFTNCPNLLTISIPESVTFISDHNFSNCASLRQVGMDSATPPELGDNTFSNSYETFVIAVPGAGYWEYNSQDRPNWYAQRDHIIAYQANNEIWYHLVGNEGSQLSLSGSDFGANLIPSGRVQIFGSTDKLRPQVPIPSEVTNGITGDLQISVYPFDATITKIPANAFSGTSWNSKLDWISFPGDVAEIGNAAFKGNSNLLVFPLSYANFLKTIGDDAFSGCSSMKYDHNLEERVSLRTSVKTVGDRAFKGCSALKQFTANGLTSLGKSAFNNCSSLTNAFIGPVSEIKDSTFYNCQALTGLILKNSGNVESVGKFAFYYCRRLSNAGSNSTASNTLDLPNLKTIDRDGFYFCSALKYFNLPELVKISPSGIGWTGAKQLSAPKLETIEAYGLYNNNLDSLSLPAIKTIAQSGLGYSVNLKKLTIGNGLTNVGNTVMFNHRADGPTDLELYLSSPTPLSSLYDSLIYDNATSTSAGAGVRIDIAAIFVPASSVNAYKIAWPDYASVIRAKP